MNRLFANLLILVVIIELGLLSSQAEPITATLGWVLASLLMLALISSVARKG